MEDGICYFSTSYGVCTKASKYAKASDDLIGCWALLTLDLNGDIHSIPKYKKPPLQTRVSKVGNGHKQILVFVGYWKQHFKFQIYDYVEIIENSTAVKSKFLGKIQNDIDLTYKGKSWKHCDVEYVISSKTTNCIFFNEMNVVKFHGSAKNLSELPDIVSLLIVP